MTRVDAEGGPGLNHEVGSDDPVRAVTRFLLAVYLAPAIALILAVGVVLMSGEVLCRLGRRAFGVMARGVGRQRPGRGRAATASQGVPDRPLGRSASKAGLKRRLEA